MKGIENILYYSLFVGIIIYTCVVNALPDSFLQIYDNNATKLVFITLIIFVCLYDPVIAILLAIAFVVSLQKRYKNKEQFDTQDCSYLKETDEYSCPHQLDVQDMNNNPSILNDVKYITS
jgi:multisubunit Na+/H+ antiporter MnhG subunit